MTEICKEYTMQKKKVEMAIRNAIKNLNISREGHYYGMFSDHFYDLDSSRLCKDFEPSYHWCQAIVASYLECKRYQVSVVEFSEGSLSVVVWNDGEFHDEMEAEEFLELQETESYYVA